VRVRTRMVGLVLGLATTGALMAAGIAGCGGGNGSASPNSTASGAPTGAQQELQGYVTCLRQHGVNISLPSGRPSGFPSGGFRGGSDRPTARPSADRSRGAGGGFGGGGFGGIFGNNGQPPAGVDQATWDAAQQACASIRPSFGAGGGFRGDNGANAAYLNCLRDHGVTPSNGPGRFNTADPTVASAMQACAALRPTAAAQASATS
jgi:hypothetical protein